MGNLKILEINEYYSRADLYELLSVPVTRQKGSWNTGYTKYEDVYYVFVNIETSGRTQHNYGNYFDEDGLLKWKSKNKRTLNSNDIKTFISESIPVLIFTRTDNKNTKFRFEGEAQVANYSYNQEENLVEFKWKFNKQNWHIKPYESFKYETSVDKDQSLTIADPPTASEVLQLTKIRIGQGQFREGLIHKYGSSCMICGIRNKNLLRASHIKPWAKSNWIEKADVNNGLLLCCNHDALFDRHLFTVKDSGELVFSQTLSLEEITYLFPNPNLK